MHFYCQFAVSYSYIHTDTHNIGSILTLFAFQFSVFIFGVLILVQFSSSSKLWNGMAWHGTAQSVYSFSPTSTPERFTSYVVLYHRSWSLFYENSLHYHFMCIYATQIYLSTQNKIQSTESSKQCKTIFKLCSLNKCLL